jgi:fatty acid synthase
MQAIGPYTLCGYSFGACVAFEMGLQLEKLNERVQLVLLDGSPSYVAAHTGNYRARHSKQSRQDEESDALTYFISLFRDVDYQKVILMMTLAGVHKFFKSVGARSVT